MRLLLVDDDRGLRTLLRTTFEVFDIEVDEADSASVALERIASRRPDVVVLDVHMPGMSGLELCRKLKTEEDTAGIGVVLLTGSDADTPENAEAAGADAFLRKPFSPLELLSVTERLAGGLYGIPFRAKKKSPDEQLILYARDLRHILEIERGQRTLVQQAYMETVSALASALESKDTGTREHSQRVQRYATALARAVEPDLIEDPSTVYGFLLHDVGKIGIPDNILQKPKPLSDAERRLMETHTVLGEQVLGGVAFLQGEGLRVVRSHHERWDGEGYPDSLEATDIPLSARVFAVADSLDAMTSNRPYRMARPWKSAGDEILRQSGRQFDPRIVAAFVEREPELRAIQREFATCSRRAWRNASPLEPGGDAPLREVADGDDADGALALDHGQMAEASVQHHLHGFDRIGGLRHGLRIGGHPLSDACLARVHAAGDRPSQVALGDDAEQAAVRGVGDDDRAHRVLNHLLGGVADRVLGLDRDHVTGHEVCKRRHRGELTEETGRRPEFLARR